MDPVVLQENLEHLVENFSQKTFIFDLLSAYDIPKSTITLLKNSPSKLSGKDNQVILKNKLLFQFTTLEEDEHVVIDDLQKDKNTYKYNPRFIIVTDFETFLAVDTKTKETLDIRIKDLSKYYTFFLPWAGMEKAQHVNENPADIRAASKMAKLYDQIIKDNINQTESDVHDLNIFLSRLLFCFFAEDTGIFTKTLFTNSIDSYTQVNGEGLQEYFGTLFDVLNTKNSERLSFAHHFTEFPYVNGGLFEKKIKLPVFTESSRKLIIECGKLGWDAINPDIFGSMIQAVVHPGQRESLGMHYTSVPNIMKVIEPLFLNDLYEELENSKSDFKKLVKLRERISKIKIFDPACGSGNFLIISYKELCKLECKIIDYSKSLGQDMMSYSGISLNSFYGIEIDDFAHEIARLSLWLAQHQMNQYFDGMFGIMKATLPLKESGNITYDNATIINWETVCPKIDETGNLNEIYVVGNPPYLGSSIQNVQQKKEMAFVFKNFKNYKNLDYIGCWFKKAADYIQNSNCVFSFVSTNSICQGEQVSLIWNYIFSLNLEIFFAHKSFKWTNNAKGKAGVSVVIVGIRRNTKARDKFLYNEYGKLKVENINPYLASSRNIIIEKRVKPISAIPGMVLGNAPKDGGNLLLDRDEKDKIISEGLSPSLIKRYVGSHEFINGVEKYCLWITAKDLDKYKHISSLEKRLAAVSAMRSSSPKKDTQSFSTVPYRFVEIRHVDAVSIIVPNVSSERREYIPIGFLNGTYVISNSASAIYNSEPWIFSLLTSRMHMIWVRTVAGRLEDRLRYSSVLCYNTFPFPSITPKQKESLASHVYNILEEREKYPEKTMADLYDPDKMPDGLREAHKYLDLAIDQIYRSKPFESDEDRLAHLFKLYEEMIARKTNK